MAGLEVIGVVLGAVPLIISALENYQKLGKKREAFLRRTLHIDRMVKELRWQRDLIRSDVELLLKSAAVRDDLVRLYISTGRLQDVLQRPDVQLAVSSYMGANWPSYLQIITEYEATLLNVAKAIKSVQEQQWVATGSLAGFVQAQQIQSGLSPNPGSDILRRVKFSMGKEDLETTIVTINRLGRLLERLRDKSRQDHQIWTQSNSSGSRVASMLRSVQKVATKLHKALTWAWFQACSSPHPIRLYLDDRLDSSSRLALTVMPRRGADVKFDMHFKGCTAPRYHVCEIEASNPDVLDDLSSTNAATIVSPVSAQVVSHRSKPKISDICATLDQAIIANESLRLWLDDNYCLHYECRALDPVHSGRLTVADATASAISLGELLENPTLAKTLRMSSKLNLVATLASSALQFYATPWFQNFRKESFFFSYDASEQLDLQHPFVVCIIEGWSIATPSAALQAETLLLDLGILILEIWHSQTFESFAVSCGHSLEDTYDSRRSVARHWIAETKDDLVPAYANAARRCINCWFDTDEVDLCNTKLHGDVFEAIVRPLWETCGTSLP